MIQIRIIPCLLLQDCGLVKTLKFSKPVYVGDPINAVKIFNEKEVDELIFLDISRTPGKKPIQFNLIEKIANESFMPFCYGGGITTIDEIRKLFKSGLEKAAINTAALSNPEFITQGADKFGSQSIVVSIDVKKNLFGKYVVHSQCGKKNTGKNPVEWAQEAEHHGAGEIIINSIDRDGTMMGYDVELVKTVSASVNIPVIACGGAGNLSHMSEVLMNTEVSALAAGSMFIFHKSRNAVLINYPERKELKKLFIDSGCNG
ncbi:MAG: AglZ/HisF2 family acetamidino modification protein [Bacteroidota bacterium]